MEIYCRKHRKFEKVVGYHRDDPILECGIIKHRNIHDDRIDQCRQDIEKLVICQAVIRGETTEKTREKLTDYFLTLSYANT